MNELTYFKKFLKYAWLPIIALAFFTFPGFAGAQLKAPSGLCADGLNCEDVSLNGLIIKVINWILAIVLAIDVLVIIIGGFLYITSAGNEERAKSGRKAVINAIIGLIIIIMAYVIAQVVNSFFSEEDMGA